MAHFAKIGLNNKVITVNVVADADCQGADGTELEDVGVEFLERLTGWPIWKKTSYNTLANKHASGDDSKAFRGNYAGIGMTYDEDNDIFISKKPYASWVLNTAEARWQSPVGDAPELEEAEKETHIYEWNEDNQSWDKKER